MFGNKKKINELTEKVNHLNNEIEDLRWLINNPCKHKIGDKIDDFIIYDIVLDYDAASPNSYSYKKYWVYKGTKGNIKKDFR